MGITISFIAMKFGTNLYTYPLSVFTGRTWNFKFLFKVMLYNGLNSSECIRDISDWKRPEVALEHPVTNVQF